MNNKLTLEIISEYINKNLCNFSNNEEIIIIEKNVKSNKDNVYVEKINFIDKINMCSIGDDIELDIKFFHNTSFIEYLSNFYVLKTYSDENNIYSFYTSILSIFDNTFINKTDEEKQKFIDYLIVHIKSDISQDGFRQHGYSTLKWTKKQLLDLIKNNKFTDNLFRVVCDILHINMFYIDYDDNNKIKYVGSDFIVFKNIILLLKINNIFYPIYNKNSNSKFFDFKSNDFIKSILLNSECLSLIFCDKFTCVGRNFNIKLDKSFENLNNSNKDDEHKNKDTPEQLTINGFEEDCETDTKTTTKNNNTSYKLNYNDEINENLSLIELQKKAKELNIEIFTYNNNVRKLKNKRDLCNDILNKN
jgi:hypothetical protein